MRKEGMQTAEGVFNVCYKEYGFQFQTPEGYYVEGAHRCLHILEYGIIIS